MDDVRKLKLLQSCHLRNKEDVKSEKSSVNRSINLVVGEQSILLVFKPEPVCITQPLKLLPASLISLDEKLETLMLFYLMIFVKRGPGPP